MLFSNICIRCIWFFSLGLIYPRNRFFAVVDYFVLLRQIVGILHLVFLTFAFFQTQIQLWQSLVLSGSWIVTLILRVLYLHFSLRFNWGFVRNSGFEAFLLLQIEVRPWCGSPDVDQLHFCVRLIVDSFFSGSSHWLSADHLVADHDLVSFVSWLLLHKSANQIFIFATGHCRTRALLKLQSIIFLLLALTALIRASAFTHDYIDWVLLAPGTAVNALMPLAAVILIFIYTSAPFPHLIAKLCWP